MLRGGLIGEEGLGENLPIGAHLAVPRVFTSSLSPQLYEGGGL